MMSAKTVILSLVYHCGSEKEQRGSFNVEQKKSVQACLYLANSAMGERAGSHDKLSRQPALHDCVLLTGLELSGEKVNALHLIPSRVLSYLV